MTDAGEHIGILHHVVHSMHLHPSAHEEALSEGLVLLVQAAQSYDTKHGVPPHYWIARKLRWGLQNWKKNFHDKQSLDEGLELAEGIARAELYHLARLELEELVAQARRTLSDQEYLSVFGPAFGLHMKELSHLLGANPRQIKKLQEQARQTLRML